MRGDFGFPLDEFWRVATTQKEAELLKSVQRCARVVSSTMLLSLIRSLIQLQARPSAAPSQECHDPFQKPRRQPPPATKP
jgi:hypothetical protein